MSGPIFMSAPIKMLLITAVLAVLGMVWAALRMPNAYLLLAIWYGSLGVVTAALFIHDKQAAIRQKRRVPERTLYIYSAVGGVFGAVLAMYAVRHKTKHAVFQMVMLCCLCVHVGVVLWGVR